MNGKKSKLQWSLSHQSSLHWCPRTILDLGRNMMRGKIGKAKNNGKHAMGSSQVATLKPGHHREAALSPSKFHFKISSCHLYSCLGTSRPPSAHLIEPLLVPHFLPARCTNISRYTASELSHQKQKMVSFFLRRKFRSVRIYAWYVAC